jgi:hypothetical protein
LINLGASLWRIQDPGTQFTVVATISDIVEWWLLLLLLLLLLPALLSSTLNGLHVYSSDVGA